VLFQKAGRLATTGDATEGHPGRGRGEKADKRHRARGHQEAEDGGEQRYGGRCGRLEGRARAPPATEEPAGRQ
jgi:hypothetical protein